MQSHTNRSRTVSRWLGGLAVGVGLCLTAGVQAADVFAPGVMKVEVFNGLDGVDINTLLNSDKYINNQPDSVSYSTSFSSPNGIADNYGARVSGYITPTESGDYDFFIRADDQAQLFISSDDKPANASLIAQEISGCCEAFKEPGAGEETTSSPVSLVANKRYYIYAIMKEGGGGDWMEVAWRKTTDTTAAGSLRVLSGSVIGTFAPAGTVTITQQPAAVTTIEGVNATFSVSAEYTGAAAPSYQWKKDNADIAGATKPTYTTPVLALSDNGAKYKVVVSVPGATTTSSEVILTVNPDTIPPVVKSAGAVRHGTGGDVDVAVIFDENINPASVVAANFSLSGGTIKSVRYIKNSSTYYSFEQGAVITATGLTPGSSYTVTSVNIADKKGNKSPSTTTPFKVSSLIWTAIGDGDTAEFPAAALAVAENGFNVNSGGNAFWSTNDDVTFVYEEITGDFDKVVRVEGQDASSQWARAGLHARATLQGKSTDAARYQQVHANPTIKADGTASNYSHETNRRLSTGAETSGSNGGGTPQYPHAWLRLRRAGDVIHMYYSPDAITWNLLNPTDFNPADGSNPDGPLPAKMYVGPVFGPENGNIDAAWKNVWTAKFRDYGDYQPNKAAGKQTYSIGVSFQDANQPDTLGPKEIAGADSIAQPNWNNTGTAAASETPLSLVADVGGVARASSATVEWTCPNTWASTGRGEENNELVGSDRIMMKGYLDTGGATTTKVTLSNIPNELSAASGGYDVVIYALGGVEERGGGYRITDANGNELKPVVLAKGPKDPTKLEKVVPVEGTHAAGTYIVFKGLTAKSIIVEGSTENGWAFGGTPRAPINGIQLVVPTGTVDLPTSKPEVSIARSANGATITFKGTLQSAPTPLGPWTDVAGATSPYAVATSAAQAYYRARQ